MSNDKEKKAQWLKAFKNVYNLIFLLYLIILILVFFYSLRFLKQNLDLTFADVLPQLIDEKYTDLDLNNYNLLAEKFNLNRAPEAIDQTASSSPELASSSNPETVLNQDQAVGEQASSSNIITEPIPSSSIIVAPTNNIKSNLKIAIINSTNTSGLAGNLKKKLAVAGYNQIEIGNQKPSLETTVLKIKTGLDAGSDSLLEIENLLSLEYDFQIGSLPADSDNDLEIVIGNK